MTIKGGREVTYRNTKLIKDLAEPLHLLLHLRAALVPESNLVRLLESHGGRLLQGRHAAVAYPGVRGRDVLDQMLRSDEIADSPASGIEGLARGADGQGALVDLRGQRRDSGERNVVQTVVDFVREDDDVVFHGEGANTLELLARKDLTNGVVTTAVSSPSRSRYPRNIFAYGELRT